MPYCYPRLSSWDLGALRLGGPGLGNLLFPWARAYLMARAHGWMMLQPTWLQFKLGPLMRRESDARSYQGIFQPLKDEVLGVRKMALLLFASRIEERELPIVAMKSTKLSAHAMVEVCGMGRLFDDLKGQDAVLHQALCAMLRSPEPDVPAGSAWLAVRAQTLHCQQAVAVHVRFGDFLPVNEADSLGGGANRRQPLCWYVDVVKALQVGLGASWRFHVFSDARDDELVELLALPGVRRMPVVSAAHDLLVMARHRILVASGSTFSMWASFLGQVPTLWFPGQRKFSLLSKSAMEQDFQSGDDLGAFCRSVQMDNTGEV